MPDSPQRPVAILCNPNTRRTHEHVKALAQLGIDTPHLIAYKDLLRGAPLAESIPRDALFRIESWGDDPGVERLLIASGGGPGLDLADDYGRYRHQVPLRTGVESMLLGLQGVLAARPDVRALNSPVAVMAMSDKRRARERLIGAGVPVAPGLDEEVIRDPAELRRAMEKAGWRQVFVKPRWGSSAAGIVALRISGGRAASYSTLELVEGGGGRRADRLYNSLRIRREDRLERIDRLLRPILEDGAVVERWVPKRAHPRTAKAMDFRIVCIGAEPLHAVIRTSQGPITNLHLGNAREPFDDFQAAYPEAAESVRRAARQAAAAFPGSVTVSADVLLEQGRDRALVLEVNSFGELLNNVTVDGATPYDALWAHALAKGREGPAR